MLRFTRLNAKRKRSATGIRVREISETRRLVLNFDPGFCCFLSIHTFTRVRSSTNPKIRRARKMKVESVYRRTIWVGSEGLKNGSRLNAACTKARSASVSKKNPAKYSLVVPVRVVIDYLFSHKEAHTTTKCAKRERVSAKPKCAKPK